MNKDKYTYLYCMHIQVCNYAYCTVGKICEEKFLQNVDFSIYPAVISVNIISVNFS